MTSLIYTIQAVVSVLLIGAILLQHRGTALGGAFGGEGNVYRSRRGVEKLLYNATIILVSTFVVLSIVHLFL